jgi:polyhydroxyalkanoate synthase
VTTSLLNAQMAWLMHPQELSRAVMPVRRPAGLAIACHAPGAGHPSTDVIQPHADDARFADPVWTESATWDIVKEWYIAFTHRLEDMFFETPGLSDKERRVPPSGCATG